MIRWRNALKGDVHFLLHRPSPFVASAATSERKRVLNRATDTWQARASKRHAAILVAAAFFRCDGNASGAGLVELSCCQPPCRSEKLSYSCEINRTECF